MKCRQMKFNAKSINKLNPISTKHMQFHTTETSSSMTFNCHMSLTRGSEMEVLVCFSPFGDPLDDLVGDALDVDRLLGAHAAHREGQTLSQGRHKVHLIRLRDTLTIKQLLITE